MSLDFEELGFEQARLNSSPEDWRKKFVKFPQGEGYVIVRFLPPVSGQKWSIAVKNHKVNGKNFHSYLEYVKGKWVGNCPIANELKKLWNEIERLERKGNKDAALDLRQQASDLRAYEKHNFNVIVRKEYQEDGSVLTNVGPKILPAGKEIYTTIVNNVMGNAALGLDKLGDVTDYVNGRDFKIVKKVKKVPGSTGFPDYSNSMFLEPSKAGTEEEWEKWLNTRHNLNEERRLKPLEEMQEALDIHFGRKAEPGLTVSRVPVQTPVRSSSPVTIPDDEPVDQDWLNELKANLG